MEEIVDFKLFKDKFGLYDIGLESNGDFSTVSSFDTAILVSLFADKRADESEVSAPERRRGWWGNAFYQSEDDLEMGSKLWIYEQARLTQATVNGVDNATNDGLFWFVTTGRLKDISVITEAGESNITINIKLVRFNSKTESQSFELWNRTGDIS